MIVHLIIRDKFTNGYIRFMQSQFKNYQQVFFTRQIPSEDSLINPISCMIDSITDCKLFEIKSATELIENDVYLKMCQAAEKIIVSGVTIETKALLFFIRKKIIKKMYFHYWGFDFYCFRTKTNGLKSYIRKLLFYYAFRKAAGLIFLIDGEYDKFREITGVSNRHFIAPMPDPKEQINFEKYRNQSTKAENRVNIIVGNSATPTNHHEEVFQMLQHFKNYNINIYCPLSYGDKEYGKEIAKKGVELFGSKFHPIFDFMKIDKYLTFLSNMDVGIFYNDRQQGLGNIYYLFALGKKVFLRSNTSMWDYFKKQRSRIYPAESIESLSIEEFCSFRNADKEINILIGEDMLNSAKVRKAWDIVFKSDV